MRVSLILAAASTAVMLAMPASAAPANQPRARSQVPGWCLNGGYTYGECVYRTLEECLRDRSGEGGYCSPNPFAPPSAPLRE
jgi:hypothetical protein